MLVVSDASPLNVLIRTSLVHVLPTLYQQIIIPSAVASEMSDQRAPQVMRDFIHHQPAWLETRDPHALLQLSGLDRGEQAAISLAREIDADLLLVDEKRGRRAAQSLNLPIIGTIGTLELAAARNLIDLTDAFFRIRQTDFSVSDEILNAALERHIRRQQIP